VYFTNKFSEVLVSLKDPVYIPPTKNLSALMDSPDGIVEIIDPIQISSKENDEKDFNPIFPGWLESQWSVSNAFTLIWQIVLTLGLGFLFLKVRFIENEKEDLFLRPLPSSRWSSRRKRERVSTTAIYQDMWRYCSGS